jgi:hypothetical protein
MQSLPYNGYDGNWYPEPAGRNPVSMPKNALYAKKHDPFMMFRSIASGDSQHIVPLHALYQELADGQVPQFVWVTPNLCDDMHGQPNGSKGCPANDPSALVKMGNSFLKTLVPAIMHSPAWRGNAAIFITWDESSSLAEITSLSAWKNWLAPGPQAPHFLGIPLGGGSVPLIIVDREVNHPRHILLWADHYNLLKTIESGFHLRYLGHAASPRVSLLSPYLP